MSRAWTGEYAITESAPALALLLVDDDIVDRAAVRHTIGATSLAATVLEVGSIDDARSALARQTFDCVLLDYQLPDASGLDLLRDVRRRRIDVPVIMLTGQNDPETAVELMRAGAADFLPKAALSADRLEAAVRGAVRLSRTERALRASQAWASTALRSIGDAVVTTDAAGIVTFVNRAAEELTGWEPSQAVGRPLAEVADCVPEKTGGPALSDRVTHVLTGRSSASQADMILHTRDGRSVPVDVRIARVRAERRDGVPPEAAVGAVMALRDITDRKAAARALELARADAERARAEAEAANRAKSEFLATMSHELRTPLNAIGGFTELISDEIYGPVAPRQREALLRIKRAQELLLGLINAVLNFAKVQAGRLPLHLSAFDVQRALDDVRPLVLPQLLGKQVAFTLRPPGEGPPIMAYADREKVQQIVLNLLSNATKFTPRGGRVELGWSATGVSVRVTVADTGVGMPAERLTDVFEPFVQLGSDRTTVGQGTGLGLAISRELARSMNGELIAESTVGVGSIFTLLLPRAP
ncbi:MAG TPA: ATP-binding protein [Gemmatimonadaceae bacterium]|nr:ATP-binding protein [Gemmatimonadaceae bacterium]